MKVKKTASILIAVAMLAGAAPVFADRYSFRQYGLTPSELETLSSFESETNYRNFVRELAVKYGVSVREIEREREIERKMEIRQGQEQQRQLTDPAYRDRRSYRERRFQ